MIINLDGTTGTGLLGTVGSDRGRKQTEAWKKMLLVDYLAKSCHGSVGLCSSDLPVHSDASAP